MRTGNHRRYFMSAKGGINVQTQNFESLPIHQPTISPPAAHDNNPK